MFNVRQLEAFRAVMESGSFTRAAEMMRISQPAVSKLLATLERQCGFELFHRRGNRVSPSPEGRILYTEVERMLVGSDAIARRAADIRDLRFGQLAIVAFPALATRTLPKLLTEFCAAHESLKVSLTSRSSWLLVDWMASQHVDVGIGLLAIDRPGVRFDHFLAFDGVCVLPPNHRLAAQEVIEAKDLEDEPFISMGTEDRSRFLVDQVFERQGIKRRIMIEAQQSEACCAFVAGGMGVSVVDPFSAAGFDPGALAVRRFRPAVTFDMWLLFPAYREPSLMTRAFIDALSAHVHRVLRRLG